MPDNLAHQIPTPSTPLLPPGQSHVSDGTSSLRAAVDESRKTIHSERLQAVKIKSGPGRPSLPRDNHGNKIRPDDPRYEAARAAQATAKPTPAPQAEAVHVHKDPQPPGPPICEVLIEPMKLVSTIPAQKHQIPELALSDGEAKAVAGSLQAFLDVWFPDFAKLDPKTATALGLVAVGGSVFIGKVNIYQLTMAERAKSKNNSNNNSNNNTENPQKTVSDSQRPPGPPINPNGKRDAGEVFG